jgi:hypothetical protein
MGLYEPVTQSFTIYFNYKVNSESDGAYPTAQDYCGISKYAVIVAETESDAVMYLKEYYKKLNITELKVLKVERKDLAVGIQGIFSGQ